MKKSHLMCLVVVSLILGLSCVALAKNPAVLSSDDAPAALGPYSQGVKLGNLVFTSGQIPLDPTSGSINGKTVGEQTQQVMENLKAILAEANLTFDDVVMVTVYLKNLGDFNEFNAAYAEFLGCPVPSAVPPVCTGVYVPPRATIQAADIPKGALLEISMIAGK